MKAELLYGRDFIELKVPDTAQIYRSVHVAPAASAADEVGRSLQNPIGTKPLRDILIQKKPSTIALVVSDITRPIPYTSFLPAVLSEIESCGIAKGKIKIIIANGMHRPSSPSDRKEMLGPVAHEYPVIDHIADNAGMLVRLKEKSWSGNSVAVNRFFLESEFRIVTGLIEPHLMAGFSGGRKAVCPGLVDIETIRNFHGYRFLNSPYAVNGILEGNPCHEESLSVARAAGVDFAINVVLDSKRNVTRAFSGDLDKSHREGCAFVRGISCPQVREQADVVIVSGGGYPLDATFYQCVKGMVAALPLLAENGTVLCAGSCSEGIGSAEYSSLMKRYSGRWKRFYTDIRDETFFVKDQWQFQMQAKVLARTGMQNLVFLTDGLGDEQLKLLSVNGIACDRSDVQNRIQGLLQGYVSQNLKIAFIPEGPYCTPLPSAD